MSFVQGWQQNLQVLQALAPSHPSPEGSEQALPPAAPSAPPPELAVAGGSLQLLGVSSELFHLPEKGQWSDSAGIWLLSILNISCLVPQIEVGLGSLRDS